MVRGKDRASGEKQQREVLILSLQHEPTSINGSTSKKTPAQNFRLWLTSVSNDLGLALHYVHDHQLGTTG